MNHRKKKHPRPGGSNRATGAAWLATAKASGSTSPAPTPEPSQPKAPPRAMGQTHWPLVLLLLAVFLVFFQVCDHEFLTYDDNQNISQNELISRPTAANLIHFWKQPFAGMYIPLTYTFWMLEATLASLLPTGPATELTPYLFHTANLLLHLANACLVFFILRRFVKNEWATLLGALLFAVHPVQVEAVAWVTGGKDLLCGFFSLLALWRYVDYAQAPAAGSRRTASYLLALGFFLAALLAKPGAVALPLVAGVIGLLLLRKNARQLLFDLGPWALLALPIVIMTKISQPDTQHQFLPTLWQRLLISGDSLSFYLLKVISPLHLGFDYGRTPPIVLQHDWIYLSGLLPYLLVAVILCKAKTTYRTAAAIFVLSLLPVSGIITFSFQSMSTVADRYLYLAMLGPALAIGWALRRITTRSIWGIAVALIALLGLKSWTQVPTWQDVITFNQHAITVNPRSWTAYGNLGNAMADQNRQQEAIGFYQQALTLKPDDEKTTFNLGVSYGLLNQREAAIAAYRKTVELVGADSNKDKAYKAKALRDAYFNLGVEYEKDNRPAEAMASYQQAIAIAPDFAFPYANLGDLYATAGQNDAAISMYRKALTLDPTVKGVNGNLGLLLAAQGDLLAAANHFNTALAQTPDDLPLRLNLGLALYQQQDFAGASRQFLQIVQAPQAAPVEISVEAYNGLGAVYMAQGQWQEASNAWRAVLHYAPDHAFAKENLQKAVNELGKAR